jgi:hypothetical protein
MLNAAIEHYLGKRISPDQPDVPQPGVPLSTGEKVFVMTLGGAAGYALVELVKAVREYRAARV